MIEPAMIQIGRRHMRRNADQSLRLFGCCEKLCCSLVGEAVHTDLSVAGRMTAQPGEGLGSVASFMPEWIEVASGLSATTHILDGDVIAVVREPGRMGVNNRGSDVAPVGLAHEKRGPRPLATRIVVV